MDLAESLKLGLMRKSAESSNRSEGENGERAGRKSSSENLTPFNFPAILLAKSRSEPRLRRNVYLVWYGL